MTNVKDTSFSPKSVREIAVKILNRIEISGAYPEKLLDLELQTNVLNKKDKALLYEIIHGVIRNLIQLDWVLSEFYNGKFKNLPKDVKNIMRVALYQLLFLDKVPAYAVVNEAVKLAKTKKGKRISQIINGVLRNVLRNKNNIKYPDKKENYVKFLSVYYSHPIWLVERWLALYGKKFTEGLLSANNRKPKLSIRVNGLVTNIEEMKKILTENGYSFTQAEYLPDYINLNSFSNISDWEYFKKGYFSIQDESTGFSCYLLNPKPGEKVLDLFSAPGGKTGLLANLMKNQGEIVAVDKYAGRLKTLKKNMERLAVTNVTVVEADALKFNPAEKFDKILLDAPCSGLGTLTKKPDIKWKRDIEDIHKLSKLQINLLEKGASLLKPGGELVFSTCTIEPEENFETIKKFLINHPEFELVNASNYFNKKLIAENGCLQTYPNIHGIDGAFAAKLKLNDE